MTNDLSEEAGIGPTLLEVGEGRLAPQALELVFKAATGSTAAVSVLRPLSANRRGAALDASRAICALRTKISSESRRQRRASNFSASLFIVSKLSRFSVVMNKMGGYKKVLLSTCRRLQCSVTYRTPHAAECSSRPLLR